MLRRLVVAIAFVAVLGTGAAVAATHFRWSGGLGLRDGNAVGMPVRVGAPFSIGMTELRTSSRVRIEAIRLHDPTPGVALVGALLHAEGHGAVGSEARFPPTIPRLPMHPAVGAVLPAHTAVELVVGLRATHPGSFRVHGVDVLYGERWHGVDLRRRTHTGVEVDICARHTSARIVGCKAPQPVDY